MGTQAAYVSSEPALAGARQGGYIGVRLKLASHRVRSTD